MQFMQYSCSLLVLMAVYVLTESIVASDHLITLGMLVCIASSVFVAFSIETRR